MQKLFFSRVVSRLRNLQCDTRLVNGIESTIHIGKRTRRDAPENPVLADTLSGVKQCQRPDRTRRTASCHPSSKRSRCADCMLGSNNASRRHKLPMSEGDATTPAW